MKFFRAEIRTQCFCVEIQIMCFRAEIQTQCFRAEIQTQCFRAEIQTQCFRAEIRTQCFRAEIRMKCFRAEIQTQCFRAEIQTQCFRAEIQTQCFRAEIQTQCFRAEIQTQCFRAEIQMHCFCAEIQMQCFRAEIHCRLLPATSNNLLHLLLADVTRSFVCRRLPSSPNACHEKSRRKIMQCRLFISSDALAQKCNKSQSTTQFCFWQIVKRPKNQFGPQFNFLFSLLFANCFVLSDMRKVQGEKEDGEKDGHPQVS